MDLIHKHWTLTIRPWTVLYPSKGGHVLNVFYATCDLIGISGKWGRPRLEACPRFPCYLHTHVLVFRYLQMHTHIQNTDLLIGLSILIHTASTPERIILKFKVSMFALYLLHFTRLQLTKFQRSCLKMMCYTTFVKIHAIKISTLIW